MKNLKITLIIPSLINQSPVKALIILANNLSLKFDITVICFKRDLDLRNTFSKKITVLNFYNPNIFKLLNNFNNYFKKSSDNVCFSYGLSSDIICRIFHSKIDYLISSLRGTLFELYPLKYGFFLGKLLSTFHNFLISKSNLVIVMNNPSLDYYSKKFKNVIKINNFINEKNIPLRENESETINDGKVNFIFLGSLTKNKGVYELIDVFSEINKHTKNFKINFLGGSPNMYKVIKYAKDNLNENSYHFYGFVKNPFNHLSNNDYLIHPSFSEGQSRSVLESLYFGLPVIIRKKLSENLVIKNVNGYIFENKKELIKILLNIINNKTNIRKNINLLPKDFREFNVMNEYYKLLNKIKL